jgi:hypothetical protein
MSAEQPSFADLIADALLGVPARLWETIQQHPTGWLFLGGAVVLLLAVRVLSSRAARRRAEKREAQAGPRPRD